MALQEVLFGGCLFPSWPNSALCKGHLTDLFEKHFDTLFWGFGSFLMEKGKELSK